MKRGMAKRLPLHVYIFIPRYQVGRAYRMIPGAFLSVFCWEIRKACSMDLPSGFRSYKMEPQCKTLDGRVGFHTKRVVQERE